MVNGDRLRFASRVQIGAARRQFKGEARLKGADGPGEAVFNQPQAKTVKLPGGTLFPLAHTTLLIDRARAISSMGRKLKGPRKQSPSSGRAWTGAAMGLSRAPAGT